MKRYSSRIMIALFFLASTITGGAQTNPTPVTFNFGFTSSKVPLSSLWVKSLTNTILTPNHVYFISGANSKIYDIFWDVATSTWTTSSGPLGGTSVPAVKSGTNIVNYGDEIFFVAASDSKVYRLWWNSTSGWQYNVVCSSQVLVAGSNIALKTHPNGCEIYYIGNTGKIYQLYFDGTTWYCGAQLSAIQSVNASTTSPLVISSTAVYYIGITDNKIYRVYWGGSSWTGGNAPLVASSTAVRGGSKIVNENNDLDHLYYINTASQICELVLNAGSWTYSVIPTGGYTVRSSTDIACSFGNIFYVNNSGYKVWRVLKIGSSWNNAILNSSSEAVKPSTQIYVWVNDIIEEGTLNTTFKSHHVFYSGYDLKINVLVYDDPICEFHAFCCTDPCDKLVPPPSGGDGIGYQDPTTGGIINPATGCGYDCSSCMGQPKVWHYGKVPTGSININLASSSALNVISKHFFFIGAADSKVYDFGRSPYNGLTKTGYGIPSWNDEFNGSTLNTAWTKADYGNPWKCYSEFWNLPSNASVGGGVLDIVAKNSATSPPLPSSEHLPFTRTQNIWIGIPNCYEDPTDGMITTNDTYTYSSALISTDSTLGPQNINPRLQYGYIESRLKVARGKHFWPNFFLYYGRNKEDINFELEGNGKVMINTLYHPQIWYPAFTTYAIGYRFYDDFYTYAVDWPSNGSSISFYINNELIGSLPNDIDTNTGNFNCTNPHALTVGLEIDSQVRALCEYEIFPGHSFYDYFRAWGSNVTYHSSSSGSLENSSSALLETFYIHPNPAKTEITISGGSFSKAEIYTIQGRKIYESVSPKINVEGFSGGVYLIKITDKSGKTQNSKFIKE